MWFSSKCHDMSIYVLSLNKCNLCRCYSCCWQGNLCVGMSFLPNWLNVMTFWHIVVDKSTNIMSSHNLAILGVILQLSLFIAFLQHSNNSHPITPLWAIACKNLTHYFLGKSTFDEIILKNIVIYVIFYVPTGCTEMDTVGSYLWEVNIGVR